jgi:hypothetical protein
VRAEVGERSHATKVTPLGGVRENGHGLGECGPGTVPQAPLKAERIGEWS